MKVTLLTRTEDDQNVVTWNTVNIEYNTMAVAVTYVSVRKTDYCNMENSLHGIQSYSGCCNLCFGEETILLIFENEIHNLVFSLDKK
jgi:hypothetical protein